MDAKLSGERCNFDSGEASNGVRKKKSLEWDLKNWEWDGHHFLATRLNASPFECGNKQLVAVSASNSSSSCSEETDLGIVQKERGESEKRRKVLAEEDNALCGEDGLLSLKLGGHDYPVVEGEFGNNGKRVKLLGGNPSRGVCQVEGCEADLSNARDYHRRHKVCEMHAKASWAMVGTTMQRFCQQCSRFHLLEEFDEGKRSCRRRLAGHNRRRRKTHPDTSINEGALADDKPSSYLLISLLKMLANLHSDKSNDHDFVSQLLENISSLAGSSDSRNISGTVQASQGQYAAEPSAGSPSEPANGLFSNGVCTNKRSRNQLCLPSKANCEIDIQGTPLGSVDHSQSLPLAILENPSRQKITEASLGDKVHAVPSLCSPMPKLSKDVLSAEGGASGSLKHVLPADSATARFRVNDFDLNCTYNETQYWGERCEQPINSDKGTASINYMPRDSYRQNPPQAGRNSDSSSVRLPSSSDGECQSRTDRIIFKLFGKDPTDFPVVLRTQILDWLSHSPDDMESYIRPGCIFLTVYLCLDDSIWEELSCNLCSSLNRLLCTSGDGFWRSGLLYARIHNRMAFVYKGNIVLDVTPLLLDTPDKCQIISMTPVAVSISARVSFTVQGFNLAQPTTRLLCAFEGKYLITETTHMSSGGTDPTMEHEGYQSLSFSCSVPDSTGRGVVEVEDHGLSNGFFPFIVAEEDVCREIRVLENLINMSSCDFLLRDKSSVASARNQAMKFLNEMGWLLRRSRFEVRSRQENSCPDLFSLKRFRWLMTFAMNQDWCAVAKKLLDILFQGIVNLGECNSPSELALSENLLHIAVKKNRNLMVKFLITYKADSTTDELATDRFLFRPDMLGPLDMTPLHVAASISGADAVLDALINDPGQLGTKAWNHARDSTGLTPEDHAIARGHQSYITLVQNKINNATVKSHVVLDIPRSLSGSDIGIKKLDGPSTFKLTSFNIEKDGLKQNLQSSCKLCDQQQLACRPSIRRTLLYRPLMLSMVGIAAVCVCVGLLFKGPPEVTFVNGPFLWDSLDYGTM